MSFFARIFGRNGMTRAKALAALQGPMMMEPQALDALLALADEFPAREGAAPKHETTQAFAAELMSKEGGVGHIHVDGPLFARSGIESWWFGGTGYDAIGLALDALNADSEVSRISMRVDSPGGTVVGAFELAAKIADSPKPVDGYTTSGAYSAGYLQLSSSKTVTASNTAGVGSVGVIVTHISVAKALDNAGYEIEHITHGAKKAQLSPFVKLSDEARADVQAEVNRLGELFVARVADNRDVSQKSVRSLEAGILFGQDAVSAGLVDAIGEPTIGGYDEEEEEEEASGAAAASVPQSAPEPQALIPSTDQIMAAGLQAPVALALIGAKLAPESAPVRIEQAKLIAGYCAAVGLPDLAADFASKGADPETVRKQLVALKADDGGIELVTSPPAKDSIQQAPSKPAPSGGSIRAAAKAATQKPWRHQ